MLYHYNYRKQSGTRDFELLSEFKGRNVVEEVWLLVKYELGYGGQVAEVTENRLVVNTSIMGCMDKTIWTGTQEEMLPLLMATAAFETVREKHGRDLRNKAFDAFSKVNEHGEKGISPLFAKFALTLSDAPIARVALLMVFGDETVQEVTEQLQKMKEDDLLAVVQLKVSEGISIKEAAALAA